MKLSESYALDVKKKVGTEGEIIKRFKTTANSYQPLIIKPERSVRKLKGNRLSYQGRAGYPLHDILLQNHNNFDDVDRSKTFEKDNVIIEERMK